MIICLVLLCYQWRSLTSNRSPRGLIYHLQTKAWTVRSRCQTRRWCSSKPDPPDLLQSSRRHPAITRLEACSRLTSHHMDPSDPPGYGDIGDWCSRAGWGVGTDRFGSKSQRRDATADRFTPWWWWWWWWWCCVLWYCMNVIIDASLCVNRSWQRKSVFLRLSSWRSQAARTQRESWEIQGLCQCSIVIFSVACIGLFQVEYIL